MRRPNSLNKELLELARFLPLSRRAMDSLSLAPKQER